MSANPEAPPAQAYKARLLVLVSVLGVVALCFVGPIPQDPSYHHFADTRTISVSTTSGTSCPTCRS